MEIKINGEAETSQENLKLSELMKLKELDKPGVVVLLNESVIKKENWDNFQIQENDSIELLRFVSGG